MKPIHALFTLMFLSGIASAQEQSLFNGKDLTGWEGKPGWWHVEDGALTSESTAEKPCRKPNYLVWTGGEPADFELSLDFKLSAKANSGVQIRSERRPDWDTYGYQADMEGDGGLVGFVYHHGRGLIAARGETVNITAAGQREAQTLGDSEALKATFRIGEWNRYRIVCSGPEITLYVNEVLMCRFSDHDPKMARSDGIIALQMHPGPPMKVQFKNIVLKIPDDREASLIAALNSDTGIQEKTDACRELARIGTPAAVPVLAGLLADERLSHMARYGLEPIPGAEADEALRAALGRLNGQPLAGLIDTIGRRRDAKAVDALVGFLEGADASVEEAAAAALGRIGTAEAAQGLLAALDTNQAAICDGLLDCAEALSTSGKNDAATAIYDALRALPEASDAVRAGALRGAILVRGKAGLPLLAESIRSDDEVLAQAGARTALELQDPDAVPLVADLLDQVPVHRQALLAGVLGKLGDARARPVLLGLAKTGAPPVRLAAIQAAAEIGGTETIAPLVALMNDPDHSVAQQAATSLAGMRGSRVDEAVVEMLNSADPGLRIRMVELVAKRRILTARPVLAGLMNDPNDALRLAAIQSYGKIADPDQFPVLLASITGCTHAADIDALGKAIALVCLKAEDPKAYVAQIESARDAATEQAKPMLVKVLRRIEQSKS